MRARLVAFKQALDDILNANDSLFSKDVFNQVVVCDCESLFVFLKVSSLSDKVVDCVSARVAI